MWGSGQCSDGGSEVVVVVVGVAFLLGGGNGVQCVCAVSIQRPKPCWLQRHVDVKEKMQWSAPLV